eukprot:TRINITY_DN27472_c0_g1_i1.p1 TRINITY_DN27472_c0_g1~~TRINITY_DN27472_c0_g1_i1.p1  ORF type:complete len:937 (+),score=241.35 TRINITY_DN27472_c0_g1_i1:87-2813(+)
MPESVLCGWGKEADDDRYLLVAVGDSDWPAPRNSSVPLRRFRYVKNSYFVSTRWRGQDAVGAGFVIAEGTRMYCPREQPPSGVCSLITAGAPGAASFVVASQRLQPGDWVTIYFAPSVAVARPHTVEWRYGQPDPGYRPGEGFAPSPPRCVPRADGVLRGVRVAGWLRAERWSAAGPGCKAAAELAAALPAGGEEEWCRPPGGEPPPDRADALRAHRDRYFQEGDVAWLVQSGANCVRVAAPWWCLDEHAAGRPGLVGSQEHVDALMGWCDAHGLSVILELDYPTCDCADAEHRERAAAAVEGWALRWGRRRQLRGLAFGSLQGSDAAVAALYEEAAARSRPHMRQSCFLADSTRDAQRWNGALQGCASTLQPFAVDVAPPSLSAVRELAQQHAARDEAEVRLVAAAMPPGGPPVEELREWLLQKRLPPAVWDPALESYEQGTGVEAWLRGLDPVLRGSAAVLLRQDSRRSSDAEALAAWSSLEPGDQQAATECAGAAWAELSWRERLLLGRAARHRQQREGIAAGHAAQRIDLLCRGITPEAVRAAAGEPHGAEVAGAPSLADAARAAWGHPAHVLELSAAGGRAAAEAVVLALEAATTPGAEWGCPRDDTMWTLHVQRDGERWCDAMQVPLTRCPKRVGTFSGQWTVTGREMVTVSLGRVAPPGHAGASAVRQQRCSTTGGAGGALPAGAEFEFAVQAEGGADPIQVQLDAEEGTEVVFSVTAAPAGARVGVASWCTAAEAEEAPAGPRTGGAVRGWFWAGYSCHPAGPAFCFRRCVEQGRADPRWWCESGPWAGSGAQLRAAAGRLVSELLCHEGILAISDRALDSQTLAARLAEIFAALDVDRSGKLDREELRAVWAALAPPGDATRQQGRFTRGGGLRSLRGPSCGGVGFDEFAMLVSARLSL